jgi:hypothetical protein
MDIIIKIKLVKILAYTSRSISKFPVPSLYYSAVEE